MIQLIEYLIFGERCKHKWKLEQSLKPFSNVELHLYSCEKCGKMKKVNLDLSKYRRAEVQ